MSREARQVLDREELRVRLAYDSAIAMAHHAYVTEMEAARLAFLVEVGSSSEVIASQRYRATVHEVTSEYQLAVSAARARHRLSQSDEFAANRDRWLDGNSKRAAPHGARLRDALIAARQAYTSKLSVARAEFLRFA